MKLFKERVLFLWGLVFFFSSAGMVVAQTSVQVENAWARESPPTVTTGAAYMTLINLGDEIDQLTAVSGDVSKTIELHTHVMEDNVMKMRQIEAIEVKPGEPTVLQPGGLHIMLIGLHAPLQAGKTFPLRLQFAKAGEMKVEVKVVKLDNAPASEHRQHHPSNQ